MLKKLRDAIATMFAHPGVTLFAVFVGLINAVAGIGGQLQQLGWQLGPVAYYMPKGSKLIIICMVVSSICTVIASVGNSIITLVRKKEPALDAAVPK